MAVPKTLTLPAIPIRDMVLFPGARVPFVVGRSASVKTLELAIKAGDHLLMLTQRDPKVEVPGQADLFSVGTLALVESVIALPKDFYKVGVKGVARVSLQKYDDGGEVIQAEACLLPEPAFVPTEPLAPFYAAVEAFLGRNPDASRLLSLDQIRELPLGKAIDTVAGLVPADVKQKQTILEWLEVQPRLDALLKLLELDSARSEVDRTLDEKTRQRLDQDHKQYVLLALPWQAMAEERLDLLEAEQVLDDDHSGLDKIKARILEHLAVMARLRSLGGLAAPSADDAATPDALPLRGPILCLVGPPGVGKTSLARSIARALNRPFVRLSLGGVRDEAEIRGHRRTYIGSMPGRIISLMKKAKVRNPLMLLDEIDKMASDFRGDPSSALLEVLDPEQNANFQDHYLDVGFDLSQVLFLATANVRNHIPEPLEDRLEILELSSYTTKEKLAIAEKHLLPRALEGQGMKNLGVHFEPAAVEKLIQSYTREAGVRQLEREIANILRKLARHTLQPSRGEAFDPLITPERLPRLLGPEKFLEARAEDTAPPGLVNGLAWTPTGGELLTIEAAVLPGKGVLKLTGKLGEVMQESANLALSYVRARSERLGLKANFLETIDLHVHVPEGGIPKDGPSAGITLATALISVLTGIPARADLAMTGELTLRGRVLPIGGLKEKLLAAHRHGRKAVLIPAENARHLEDVPAEVREQLSIHLVSHMDEVIQLALTRMPEPLGPEPSPPQPTPPPRENPATAQ